MKILAIGDFHGKFPEKLKRRIKKEEFDIIVALGDFGGIEAWRPYLNYIFKLSKESKEWPSAEEYFGKKKFKQLIKKDDNAAGKVLNKVNALGKTFFIFGNGDDDWYDYPFQKFRNIPKANKRFISRLKNMKNITYSSAKMSGLNFVGFGGYMDVMANWTADRMKNKKSYKKMIARVSKSRKNLFSRLRKHNADVLVLHYTPKGVFDIIHEKKNPYYRKSAGIPFFTEAIKKYKPKLVLCGHMHEYQGKKKLGKSLIINPGDAERGRFAVVDVGEKDIKVKFYR